MEATVRDELVFPIGQRLGPYYYSDDPDEVVYRVRVGADVLQLEAAAHRLWELAHGSKDDDFDDLWTVHHALAAAEKSGVEQPAAVLDDLVEKRCLTTVGSQLDGYVAFARRYRMVPAKLGLGNSPRDPATFAIGLLNQATASVDATIYDMYQWSYFDRDLWSACQGAAELNRRLKVIDPVATEADLLLGVLVDHLHALLLAGAVYLDLGLAERDLVSRFIRSSRRTPDG